jgi:threonine dehydrogenase-like Zn-dependent dehydrogenase
MEYAESISLLKSGKIRVDDMISVTGPLEMGAEFFDKLYTRSGGIKKAVLNP